MLKIIDKEYIIYRHTSPNGKVYIGQTNQKLEDRFKNGEGYKSSKKFYNSILKYGWDNFTHEILFSSLNKISADCIETDLIYYYKSIGISLNIANGGEGRTRDSDSEETKRKMSIAQLKRFHEHGHPSIGKKWSQESKDKLSKSKTGTIHDLSTKQKIKDSMLGKNSTPVLLYNKEGIFISEFKSLGDCAKYLNVAWSTVSAHLQGRIKSIHRKYIVFRKYDKDNKKPTTENSR